MAEAVFLAVKKIGTVLGDEHAKAIIAKLSENVQALKELPRKIENIGRKLKLMANVIQQIGTSYLIDKVVESWIGEVRKVAHHAEDVVDKYSYHVLQAGKEINSFKNERFLKKFFIKGTKYRNSYVFSEIADEVANIEQEIQQVIQLKDQWLPSSTLVPDQQTAMERQQAQHCFPEFVKDEDLIGIEANRRLLTRWLYSKELDSSVMAVSGMGGLGKSTLVTNVYEREKVNFPVYALIVVSQIFTVDALLRELLWKIGQMKPPVPTEIHKMDVHDLKEEIKKKVQNTKCLIVLDDVWEQEAYFKIHDAFQNHQASRIIITTRKNHVAALATSNKHLVLRPLDEPDAFELFCRRAFHNKKDHKCPKEFEEIAKAVVDRCHGLPLAIVTIGRWLSSRPQRDIWNEAYYNLGTVLSNNDHVRKILNLSYHDLSIDLRNCFLYCMLFPEDYPMSRESLVRLWVAEGFALRKEKSTPEEVAERNLMELINRNMLEVVDYDEFARVSTCKMHGIMRDLAVSVAKEEKLFGVANDYKAMIQLDINVRRLLSFRWEDNTAVEFKFPRLRTFVAHEMTLATTGMLSSFLSESRYLTVLELQDSDLSDPGCLDGVSKLLLLRYLGLRGTGVSELPAAIWELRCLERLDVRSTKVIELPRSIVGLRNTLRTLLFNHDQGTINLTETTTRIAEDIQHCRELENLATIDLREHQASFVKDLGALDRLRVVTIIWSFRNLTDASYREALLSSIQKWRNLKSLTIHCGLCCSMEFLDSLSDPPRELETFKVTLGRFAYVPPWIKRFESLSFLQITICKIETENLKILKDLPELKCLILGLEFVLREAIVIESEGFSNLRKFSVNCPVPWITFEIGAMPKVTHLQLELCSGSATEKSVPHGISNLERLTEVVLNYNQEWCANSSSVTRTVDALKRQVAKHGNRINLVINDTKVYVVQKVDDEPKSTTGIQSGEVDEAAGSTTEIQSGEVDEEAKRATKIQIGEVDEEANSATKIQSDDVQQVREAIARTTTESQFEIEIVAEGNNINNA